MLESSFYRTWYGFGVLLLLLMVSVGGLTRLTDSGLSITQWELFSGILPPFNQNKWNEYFDLYKQIPEYKKINYGMSLSEFKFIFWWEYIHRVLARFLVLFYIFTLKMAWEYRKASMTFFVF